MKNIKIFTLSLITVFSISFLNAQDGRIAAESQMFLNKSRTEMSNIKGSPYLSEDFVSATITPLDKVYLVRYNAQKDEMEVKDEKGRVLILNKNMKTYVVKLNTNNKDVFKILAYEPYNALGYFIILSEMEKVNLYKKETKIIQEGKPAAYSNMSSTPTQYKLQRPSYYFNTSENPVLKNVPRNKKQILKMFPEYESDLKTFVKKNKLRFKDDSDFITLFKYLNDIM